MISILLYFSYKLSSCENLGSSMRAKYQYNGNLLSSADEMTRGSPSVASSKRLSTGDEVIIDAKSCYS